MKIKYALVGILAGGAVIGNIWAGTVAEDDTKKTFSVSDGGTLKIEADRGSIEVKTGASQNVEIEVLRKVERGSEANAKELLAAHVLTFNQDGKNILVKGELPGKWTSGWRGPNLSVKYVVSVPRNYNADLKTAGGDIVIAELNGEGHYRTSGGNIKVGRGTGEISAKTSGGDITVAGCDKSIDLETSGGSIKAGEIAGDAKARTSGGDIHLTKVGGVTDAHTSGGNILADQLMGTAQASTSGGNVKASFSKQPEGKCVFKTSGGNVELALADSVSIDVDAHTSGGTVKTEFATGDESKHNRTSLKTKINNGGPLVVLQTSGGDVRIRKM
ncbi:MAG: hypothetical protein JWM99_1307 [Verrucomicrobiales bacterium]|nr:hypothetical protein [Verrucomicrobiales bacterium]